VVLAETDPLDGLTHSMVEHVIVFKIGLIDTFSGGYISIRLGFIASYDS
jgi:hypothetical protein